MARSLLYNPMTKCRCTEMRILSCRTRMAVHHRFVLCWLGKRLCCEQQFGCHRGYVWWERHRTPRERHPAPSQYALTWTITPAVLKHFFTRVTSQFTCMFDVPLTNNIEKLTYLTQAFKRLGKYEPVDQIDAAKQISQEHDFIDKGRIAIWGRGYGG